MLLYEQIIKQVYHQCLLDDQYSTRTSQLSLLSLLSLPVSQEDMTRKISSTHTSSTHHILLMHRKHKSFVSPYISWKPNCSYKTWEKINQTNVFIRGGKIINKLTKHDNGFLYYQNKSHTSSFFLAVSTFNQNDSGAYIWANKQG